MVMHTASWKERDEMIFYLSNNYDIINDTIWIHISFLHYMAVLKSFSTCLSYVIGGDGKTVEVDNLLGKSSTFQFFFVFKKRQFRFINYCKQRRIQN